MDAFLAARINKLLKEMDADGDGQISREEVVAWLHRHHPDEDAEEVGAQDLSIAKGKAPLLLMMFSVFIVETSKLAHDLLH